MTSWDFLAACTTGIGMGCEERGIAGTAKHETSAVDHDRYDSPERRRGIPYTQNRPTMKKPVGNEQLIAVGIIGIGVLATMRAKEAAAVEVVSMALLFGGIFLVALADRAGSVPHRWWGIGVMSIGLAVMMYSAFA